MASAKLPPVMCLMGPTASGKTELAMHLYDHFPCELVSVDSVLVYRGMDIGSAKPDAQTLERYPHHLINILDPAEAYSAARFRDEVTPFTWSYPFAGWRHHAVFQGARRRLGANAVG